MVILNLFIVLSVAIWAGQIVRACTAIDIKPWQQNKWKPTKEEFYILCFIPWSFIWVIGNRLEK